MELPCTNAHGCILIRLIWYTALREGEDLRDWKELEHV